MTEALLAVDGLVKRFGGLVAVNGVDFDVAPGTITGLIGINGAGKTTVMNCVNGIYRSDGGTVRIGGVDATRKTPHEIAHLGVGRTFQVPRTFHRMTLIDNLLVPVLDADEADDALYEKAAGCLDRVNLYDLRHNHGEELSGGQQKLLELARIAMLDPRLVLLDEPFAGVNPSLCRIMIREIERLRDGGKTFLLVSHDLTSIYRLSDVIVVLNQGEVIATGDVEAIKTDPAVIEAYLGN